MSEQIRSIPARSLGDIKQSLHARLPWLRQRYHVRSRGIFGSYVGGQQRPESDLDVLVGFTETPGLLTYIALRNELSDLLGVPADLVRRSALEPRIGQRIAHEVIPV